MCLSIAGGAMAVIGLLVAVSSRSEETMDLVIGVDTEGLVTTTLTPGQLVLFVGVLVALEIVVVWAASLLFARGLHPAAWVIVAALAALATVFLVRGAVSGQWWASSSEYLYIAAFPVIAIAGVLELVRARRLRAKWGEAAR